MRMLSRNESAGLASRNHWEQVSATLSILGVPIRVQGCPGHDVELILQEYAAFRTEVTSPTWVITWNGTAEPTELVFDGKLHRGVSRDAVAAIISTKIMDRVYHSVEAFYLFHGAAAAYRDVLLLFPGESGAGKSSLSLSLGNGGWSLFSDEVIPISRKDCRVSPFPRAILIWKDSPALADFLRGADRAKPFSPKGGRGTKTLIPFSLFNKPSAPLAPTAILCLRGGRREVRRGGHEIAVTYWDETMEKLATEKGIHGNLRARRVGDFWCIKSDHMEVVEDICNFFGSIIVEREVVENHFPVFGDTPELQPMSPSECLGRLWSVFENGRTLARREGSVPALYLRVARLVKSMPCFWLRPGSPTSTRELLQHLAEKLARRKVSNE